MRKPLMLALAILAGLLLPLAAGAAVASSAPTQNLPAWLVAPPVAPTAAIGTPAPMPMGVSCPTPLTFCGNEQCQCQRLVGGPCPCGGVLAWCIENDRTYSCTCRACGS